MGWVHMCVCPQVTMEAFVTSVRVLPILDLRLSDLADKTTDYS